MKNRILEKFLLLCSGMAVFLSLSVYKAGRISDKPIYLNTSYSFEERAADLVSRFMLEEKEKLMGNNKADVDLDYFRIENYGLK